MRCGRRRAGMRALSQSNGLASRWRLRIGAGERGSALGFHAGRFGARQERHRDASKVFGKPSRHGLLLRQDGVTHLPRSL